MKPDDLELYEFNTHAFVIKIWLEDSRQWRGHITHVPSGERIYIESFCEIVEFISTYLEQMGTQRRTLEYLCNLWRRVRSPRPARGIVRKGQERNDGASE